MVPDVLGMMDEDTRKVFGRSLPAEWHSEAVLPIVLTVMKEDSRTVS